jgi:hypothetical protein
VHWKFWNALSTIVDDSLHWTMSSPEVSEAEDFGGDAGAAFVHDSQPPFESQESQSQHPKIPDSYHVVSRFPLPGAAYASMPPGNRAVHDRLKPAFVAMLPNVHRFFDTTSRAIAQVSWEFASAEEIWAIVTCKLLAAGKMGSMAYYKNTATSYVHSLVTKFVSIQRTDASVQEKVRTAYLSCFIQL